MAVSVTICSQDFAGAVSGVALPVNFPVLDIGDIYAAYLLVGGETFINLTPETDFTRQDLGGGHYTLTPLATYASDIIFKVFRSTAIIQPYSFDPLGPLPADQVSGMGDRLCMLEQETRLLAGIDGPAVTLPPGATGFFPTAIAADSTARGNLIPLFVGQLLVQLNTGDLYHGTALTAGAWTLIPTSGGSGDVVGPAAATNNAVARYDTTTGKLLQDSLLIVDDSGNVLGVVALTASGVIAFTNGTDSASGTTGAVLVSGGLGVAKNIVSDATVACGAAGSLLFNTRAQLVSATSLRLGIRDNALAGGFDFKLSSANVAIFRKMDDSGFADIQAGAGTWSGTQTLADVNFVLGTATGTKLGTSATQKLGFWNQTPAVQPATVAAPTGGATVDTEGRASLSDLLTKLKAIGIIAT